MKLSGVFATLCVVLVCVTAATADDPALGLFAHEDTWAESVLATRNNYSQWQAERQGAEALELSPWHATNPIPAESLDTPLFPEEEVDLASRDEENRRQWRRRTSWVDGTVHDLPTADYAATYLYRTISAPEAATVTAAIGSDDGVAIWLNDTKIFSNDVARSAAPNQDEVALPLEAGENTLLMKIYNRTGAHGFYFALVNDPAPVLWEALQQAFPREMALAKQDGADHTLISTPDGLTHVPTMITSALRDTAPYDAVLRAEQEQLQAAAAPQDDPRWLTLYARTMMARQGARALGSFDPEALRRSIDHLAKAYPEAYPKGAEFRARLDAIEANTPALAEQMAADPDAAMSEIEAILAFERKALLANPLLDFDHLLLVRRHENRLGLPQNWQGNCSLPRNGYENEIALLDMHNLDGDLQTVFRPDDSVYVGDLDLHFDGERMLFSMPGSHRRWQIWEIGVDGSGLRQVTPGEEPDVDNYDACYLPDERIIFASTRIFQGIPCVAGSDAVANLFIMDQDGGNTRQLCFDQDHNWSPAVMNDGRVLFTRWEYSDTAHYFTRLLFSMNPDGTNQLEYYGSNSYWPNSMFYSRPIPEHPTKVVTIVSGHHGVPRMGELILLDPAKGRHEGDGVVQRIPGYDEPVDPIIEDYLVDASWPKFLHPYPLDEHYFLVSCKPGPDAAWGLYLVDVFDNMVLLHEEPGYVLFEPIPLRPRKRPPIITDRVDLTKDYAKVYLTDIYEGPGLEGVPRGTVKNLRLFAFHYTYPHMGGHEHVGVEGPWDVRRILGTVPVLADGSAFFKVPANTPIGLLPLDDQNRALQVMRSWFTAMPGEVLSCVGCHESQNMAPRPEDNLAARQAPAEIAPWYGRARGFSFHHEVQPVLDRHCVGCHNPEKAALDGRPDFSHHEERGWKNFNKSYLALHPFVRRPGPESDYHIQIPLEWHAETSELIQMLRKGHKGVELDDEAWDRLFTWIDLNVPDHGRWSDHAEIPGDFHRRRAEMRAKYALLPEDDTEDPLTPADYPRDFIEPTPPTLDESVPEVDGWPFSIEEARARQAAMGVETERTLDLGDGVTMEFVLIPAGEFVMGGTAHPDELPMTRVRIEEPFWLGKTEVTNEQYNRFNPDHNSRYINQHHKDHTTAGYPANKPEQPVIRISWHDALSFCDWLSEKTGTPASLPTEAQWEWACRAGSDQPLFFGDLDTDFSAYANLADYSMRLHAVSGVDPQPIPNPTPYQNFLPQDARFNDGQFIVCEVGLYKPNPWGLYDMHGNVNNWTLSAYHPYPYCDEDGRNDLEADCKRVVRGGSWRDRPMRARSAFRLPYQPWQGVFNVGFRVALPY